MNCEQCRDTLIEYYLGDLTSELKMRVEQHLAQPCVGCQRELQEIEQSLHSLSGTLPPIEPPPEVKAELLARIRQERETPVSTGRVTAAAAATQLPARWRHVLPYAAAMLVAAALGAATERHWRLDRLAQMDQLEFDRRLDISRRLFSPPRMELTTLSSTTSGTAHAAYLVGDALAGEWHFYAFDLAPPPAGQHLQLWFYTSDERWLAGGQLSLRDDGSCSTVLATPRHAEIQRVVITLESASDAQEPRGPVQFSADLPGEPQ